MIISEKKIRSMTTTLSFKQKFTLIFVWTTPKDYKRKKDDVDKPEKLNIL